MDDCHSFSSKPKWMERECQSLMCLMARRDIEIEISSVVPTISPKNGKLENKRGLQLPLLLSAASLFCGYSKAYRGDDLDKAG